MSPTNDAKTLNQHRVILFIIRYVSEETGIGSRLSVGLPISWKVIICNVM